MNILLSGASGLIGTACRLEFRRAGHEVAALSRDGAGSGIPWEVSTGRLYLQDFAPDAVIHLAGESLANGRWSEQKMKEIRASRVDATQKLAEWLAELPAPPKIFLSASAIGLYGTKADRWLIETSPNAGDFLGQLSADWERATQPLERAGSRVVNMRIGVVLSPNGGALAKLLPFFRLGLGGPLGSGDQFMSWIALEDAVRAILFLLEHDNVSGPVNLVSPNPVTNAEFTQILSYVLRRPAFLRVPGSILHLLYGDMAESALLASQRVKPQSLLELGFHWNHPELEGALRSMLQKR